tara:strand:+ start:771 stop:899 length:129 start_codon:yes stop_codon:yes gene_type:complete
VKVNNFDVYTYSFCKNNNIKKSIVLAVPEVHGIKIWTYWIFA